MDKLFKEEDFDKNYQGRAEEYDDSWLEDNEDYNWEDEYWDLRVY